MEKEMVNPYVIEHIQVLEEYFKVQRELFEVVKEKPLDVFELNSHKVKLMELNNKMDVLSEKLNETVVNLGKIKI